MSNVKKAALKKAIALLNALQAQYKIILPDGEEHGELVIAQTKKQILNRRPHGALSNIYIPYLSKLKPGDVCEVPAGEFKAEDMRSSMAGWIVSNWGKGSAITAIDRKANAIEVLRVA